MPNSMMTDFANLLIILILSMCVLCFGLKVEEYLRVRKKRMSKPLVDVLENHVNECEAILASIDKIDNQNNPELIIKKEKETAKAIALFIVRHVQKHGLLEDNKELTVSIDYDRYCFQPSSTDNLVRVFYDNKHQYTVWNNGLVDDKSDHENRKYFIGSFASGGIMKAIEYQVREKQRQIDKRKSNLENAQQELKRMGISL